VFVVRWDRKGLEPDFKAFVKKRDGQRRFVLGRMRVVDRDLEASTLFEVEGEDDVRAAVAAVKDGRARLLELYSLEEERRLIELMSPLLSD
jgi:hypothetical protein